MEEPNPNQMEEPNPNQKEGPSDNFIKISNLLTACSNPDANIRQLAFESIQTAINNSQMEFIINMFRFLQESKEITLIQIQAATYLHDAINPVSDATLHAIQIEWSNPNFNQLRNDIHCLLQTHIFDPNESYQDIIAQLYATVFLIEQKAWTNGILWIIEQLQNTSLQPERITCILKIISNIFALHPISNFILDPELKRVFQEFFWDLLLILQRPNETNNESIYLLRSKIFTILQEMLNVHSKLLFFEERERLAKIQLVLQILLSNFPIPYLSLYQSCFSFLEVFTKSFYKNLRDEFPGTQNTMFDTILLCSHNLLSLSDPCFIIPFLKFWYYIANFENSILTNNHEQLTYFRLSETFIKSESVFPNLFRFMIPSKDSNPNEIEDRNNPDLAMWATVTAESFFTLCPNEVFLMYSQAFMDNSKSPYWQHLHASAMILECFSHLNSNSIHSSELNSSQLVIFVKQSFPILLNFIKITDEQKPIPRLIETVLFVASSLLRIFPSIISCSDQIESENTFRTILYIININEKDDPLIIRRYLNLLKSLSNAFSCQFLFNPIIALFAEINDRINYILTLPQMEKDPELIFLCFDVRSTVFQDSRDTVQQLEQIKNAFIEQTLNLVQETITTNTESPMLFSKQAGICLQISSICFKTFFIGESFSPDISLKLFQALVQILQNRNTRVFSEGMYALHSFICVQQKLISNEMFQEIYVLINTGLISGDIDVMKFSLMPLHDSFEYLPEKALTNFPIILSTLLELFPSSHERPMDEITARLISTFSFILGMAGNPHQISVQNVLLHNEANSNVDFLELQINTGETLRPLKDCIPIVNSFFEKLNELLKIVEASLNNSMKGDIQLAFIMYPALIDGYLGLYNARKYDKKSMDRAQIEEQRGILKRFSFAIKALGKYNASSKEIVIKVCNGLQEIAQMTSRSNNCLLNSKPTIDLLKTWEKIYSQPNDYQKILLKIRSARREIMSC